MNFNELGITDALARKCASLNYTTPTPIQRQAIPVILRGTDLIGCAATGTGKTAAFLLPVMQRMDEAPKTGVRVLIVAPTRELALQIEQTYRQLSLGKIPCVSLIGGASIKQQCDALRRGPGVVVATPGRLLDHLERGTLSAQKLETLILDEADRMLDMGFLPQIRKILARVPQNRQTLLFSATMSTSIKELARSVMNRPEIVRVDPENATAQTVEQVVYPVAASSKTALLIDLLEKNDFERVIVFTRTRRSAERIAHVLSARELKANRIHADRSQSQRESALRDFKQGKTRVLVATDIASRGIDVESVSHVINYDVPAVPEDYVHRVGRTGRAGNTGQAITLVTPIEEVAMRGIERLTSQTVKRVFLPNFGASEPVAAAFVKTAPVAAARPVSVRSFRPRRGR